MANILAPVISVPLASLVRKSNPDILPFVVSMFVMDKARAPVKLVLVEFEEPDTSRSPCGVTEPIPT